MSNANILVVINQYSFPLRSTIRDSIFCFKKYSDSSVYFLNTARLSKLPKHFLNVRFDIILFHTSFMSFRWGHQKEFNRLSKLLDDFKSINSVKIALPQDEWIHTDLLNTFINEFNIKYVFSVAPETEWRVIYNEVNFSNVQFYRILTGYIDPLIVDKYAASQIEKRLVDVGYRAFKAPPWLGKHGYMKTLIANIFTKKCNEANLVSDISVDERDTFLGDKWYGFLKKCKYFIGVEGGSTVLDRDGTIWEKGVKFLNENPDASYDEVEKAVFPEKDGSLNLVAISPRHLECCITKTCQILIEGDYNGILIPNKHFIELREDFSNLSEVISIVKNDNLREKITEQAFADIVKSNKYSYPSFVKFVLNTAMEQVIINDKNNKNYLFLNNLHYQKQFIINYIFCLAYKYYKAFKNLYFYFTTKLHR